MKLMNTQARRSFVLARAGARSPQNPQSRVGVLEENTSEASSTVRNVVYAMGIGVTAYIALKFLFPAFTTAASHTKRASHEYKQIGKAERERDQDRAETKRLAKQALKDEREDRAHALNARRRSSAPETIDAEFEEDDDDNDRLTRFRGYPVQRY